MKLQCYAVYDIVSKSYGTPFFVINDEVATRAFTQLINDPNSTPYCFPADFDLYRIGSYNDEDGMLWEEQPTALICKGAQVFSALQKHIED